MRRWCLGVLALVLGASHAQAVPLQPGQRYQGGTELEIAAARLSLTVPDGWVAVLPPGGSMLVMTPDDQSYVLAMAKQATLEEARSFLSNPLSLGNGVVLQPTAPPKLQGQELVVPYSVAGGDGPYEGFGRARQLPNGVVAGVFALAGPGALEPVRRVAEEVLAGIRTAAGQPQTAEGSAGSGGADDSWQSYLMGRHLVRYYTGSGYNEEQHIYLCSDGHFRKIFESGGHTTYGDGWSSGATQNNNVGQWHAAGTGNTGTLVLQFGDGSRSEIYLEYRNNNIYFDGVQWLRDPENRYCS